MSLFSAAERLSVFDRSTITLEASRCLHSHDRFSTCTACFELCPAGAIQPGKPPTVNVKACAACMACLPACPAGAFVADGAVPNLLNCAARLETDSIELLCERHPLPEKGLQGAGAAIRVKGCLAGISSGGYFALLALGLKSVMVRDDACGECVWGPLKAQINGQIGSAQMLLPAWERAEAVQACGQLEPRALVKRPVWEAGNPPLSRRELFRLAAREGKATVARLMSADPSAAGKHAPRERQRFLTAVAHLPKHVNASAPLPLDGQNFAVLSISEECTACGVCARACPTGALVFAKDETLHYQLNFNARTCIACGACAAVCAPKAIVMNRAPTFEQVFDSPENAPLISGMLTRCDHCGALLAARPGARLCSICDFRQKNHSVPGC